MAVATAARRSDPIRSDPKGGTERKTGPLGSPAQYSSVTPNGRRYTGATSETGDDRTERESGLGFRPILDERSYLGVLIDRLRGKTSNIGNDDGH